MGKVQFKRGTTSELNAIDKNPDTLYAVNDSGDFTEESMDETCALYVGDKRATPLIEQKTGQSTTAVMSQKATTDAINNFVLPYGECSTAGATAAKVVTTSEGTFTLKRGARVMVKFINTHTASSMTLNVNGTGAKGVYWNGVAVDANKVFGYTAYEFVYDGTYYRITGIATYNNATTSTSGLMSSADKTKLDGLDLSKYLPLTGGTLTGSLTTKGLIVNGGDVKLANFSNGKIHGHQSSQAIGNYSTALGYNSRTQVPTGDSSLPYGYITSVSPLSFAIVDDTLYGVSLAKNDSTTYTYNGVNYTVTNPNATYHASVFLVKDSDNTLLKGTSYPNNVCVIAKSSVTVGTGRILAVKNIVDDVYEVIVNQQDTTLQSYTSSLTLYVFKKSSSGNYNGYSSVASGASSVASGAYSVASGNYSVASGPHSVASGYYSVASGGYSVASGYYSVASGNFSVASGYYSVASGYYSVASGGYSVASGYYSVASGASSVASGNYSVASGYYSVASGTASVASGYYSVASGTASVASGRWAKSSHEASFVSAYYGLSGRTYQTVLGYYNEQNSSAALVIGWGSGDTSRKNIFTVNTDGTTNIAGNLLPMTTNTKSLGSTSLKWANVYATTFNGNATSATKVNKALTIKQGSTTDTYDGSAAKTIDITKLNDIGTLSDLQTSNKTTIVDAINEVNTKANNNLINNEYNVVAFHEYIDNAVFTQVQIGTTESFDGIVYFIANAAVGEDPNTDKRKPIFAYKQGDIYYTSDTLGYLNNYVTQGDDGSYYIRQDKLFSFNGQLYLFNGEQLLPTSEINKMPEFDGIVETATISTNQPYANGRVIFVKDAGTFVNYYEGTYYRDWSKQNVYIDRILRLPHTNRIFWFRNIPYMVIDGSLWRINATLV